MTAVGDTTRISVQLLGRFEVRAGERAVLDRGWPYVKAKSLVKMLALAERRTLHREQALDALWPDLDPGAAANNLRQALHQVRTAFMEANVDETFVERQGDLLTLSAAAEVDVDAFRDNAELARRERTDISLFESALSLYGGELLPEDPYDDWAQRERDSLKTLRRELLMDVARLHQGGGSGALAIQRLQQALDDNSVDEEAHRMLMRAYTDAGQRERALRQYQACRQALDRELGVPPSPETDQEYAAIIQGGGIEDVQTARPPRSRHATTTIMFTDLVGSTELGTRLGDDAVMVLRRAHDRILGEQFSRHGGTVVKNTGDGFMVAFQSARQATECGAAIQRAIGLQHAEGRYGDLRIRVGIHTGEPTAEGDDYFGSDVDLARRITDTAGTGEVWVSDVTRLLARQASDAEFVDCGEHSLKGFDQRVSLHSLARSEEQPASSLARFVGRAVERTALRQALDGASQGHGSVILISGEPGVGKTRLASEIAIEAGDRGFSVLTGRSFESERATPYLPVSEALSNVDREFSHSQLQAALGGGGAYLTRLVPHLRTVTRSLPEDGSPEPEVERLRLFEGAVAFVTSLAAQRPLLIFLDDLHWADAGSLLLIQHLATRTQRSRLLVIATYRDSEVAGPLSTMITGISRHKLGQRIALAPFGRDESALLIESIARSRPAAKIVDALFEETRGNALFLVETARSLVDQGTDLGRADVSEGWRVPDTIRSLIAERTARLSKERGDLLGVAAVFGHGITTPLIAAAAGIDETAALDALEAGITARILDEDGDGFAFTHPVIQQTLYQNLSNPRRSLLHRQAGAALERVLGPHPDHAAQLAYHYCAGGEREKGLHFSRLAGGRARELLAYEDAAAHYQQSLELLRDDQQAERFELLLDLGAMLWLSGEYQTASETKARAIEVARSLNEPLLFARAVLDLHMGYAQLELEADEHRIALLEEALEKLGPDDSPIRAKLLARLAARFYFSPDEERRLTLSEQAVAMARRTGEAEALAFTLTVRHYALREPGYIEERLEAASEIVELAGQAGIPAIALSGYSSRVQDLLALGKMPEVDDALDAHRELAEAQRHHSGRVHTAQLLAMREMFDGRFEDAERHALEGLELGQRAGSRAAIAIFGTQVFLIRKEQGKLHEIEGAHRALTVRYPTIPAYRCGLAALYSELGQEVAAREQFEELMIGGEVNLPPDTNWLTGVAFLSEACAFLGEGLPAERLFELLLPYDRQHIVVGYGTLCLGPAARYLGLLATTMGRIDEAEAHFATAVEMSEKAAAKPWLARSQHDYGRMLLERGPSDDREQASAMLSKARKLAEDTGMLRLVERIKELEGSCLEQRPSLDGC